MAVPTLSKAEDGIHPLGGRHIEGHPLIHVEILQGRRHTVMLLLEGGEEVAAWVLWKNR